MPKSHRRFPRTDRRPRSIEEAADYLGVSVRTMRTLRYHPELPVAKIAGKLRWDPDDLDAFLELAKEVV